MFTKAMILSASLIWVPISALAQSAFDPPPLKTSFLARFTVDLEPPIYELGKTTALGNRRIIPITGGHFEGERLKGEIKNNGADWQVVTPDGIALIETRYLLKTDDGALIYLRTDGYRHGRKDVLDRVAKGEDVDPASYYFRITMRFETSDAKYQWLNKTIGIGTAMRLGKAVIYDAYTLD